MVKLHLSLVSTVIFSAARAGAAIIMAAMAHRPSLFILKVSGFGVNGNRTLDSARYRQK
jgi:hypothetical protein